jgi:hypothetical protein
VVLNIHTLIVDEVFLSGNCQTVGCESSEALIASMTRREQPLLLLRRQR